MTTPLEQIKVEQIESHAPRQNCIGGRSMSPHEHMMTLANERVGISNNLIWHGYKHEFIPEKRIHVFIKQNV